MAEQTKNPSAKKPVKDSKKKNAKPNIFTRLASLFKSVRAELKRVMWTDRKSLKQNSGAVIFILISAAVMIFVFDWFVRLLLGVSGFYRIEENAAPPALPTQVGIEAEAVPGATEAPPATTTVGGN